MSGLEKISDEYLRGIRDFAWLAYGMAENYDSDGRLIDFFSKVMGDMDEKREDELTERLYKQFGIKRPDWDYESDRDGKVLVKENSSGTGKKPFELTITLETAPNEKQHARIQAIVDGAHKEIKSILASC